MPTYSPFTEQADCLRTDIRDVMSQIHSAESGNRLERDQFLALITKKNSILADALLGHTPQPGIGGEQVHHSHEREVLPIQTANSLRE